MDAPAAWTGAGTLLGQKALLESELQRELVGLRERELQFHIYHFQALGVVSSVFMGGALMCATSMPARERPTMAAIDGASLAAEAVFATAAICALGFFALVATVALLLSVYAPRLALHGPDSSMHATVEELHAYRAPLHALYGCGLAALFVCVAAYPHVRSELHVAAPTSAAAALSAVATLIAVRRVHRDHYLPSSAREHGVFGEARPPRPPRRGCAAFCAGCGAAPRRRPPPRAARPPDRRRRRARRSASSAWSSAGWWRAPARRRAPARGRPTCCGKRRRLRTREGSRRRRRWCRRGWRSCRRRPA